MALAESVRLLVGLLCTHAALAATGAAPQIDVVSKPYTNIAHVFGDSSGLLLSTNGRWAAFNSTGNGLATNDSNGAALDVFLKDFTTGETRLVSRDLSRASANGDSTLTGMSADARFVLFESYAPGLTVTDGNELSDVFIYDRDSGAVSAISAGATGTFAGESGASTITRNGRFILFESNADRIVPQDTNGATDLFLLDRQSGSLSLVSWNADNTAPAASTFGSGILGAFKAAVSEDGRYVAFLSFATNIAAGLRVDSTEVYLRDMLSGQTRWISQNGGHAGQGNISAPLLSTNGMVVAFLSASLAAGPASAQWLHLYSLTSNVLSEVPAPPGTAAGATIDEFALSPNGKIVAYVLNTKLYSYDLASGVTVQIWSEPTGIASQPVFADDGETMVFLGAVALPGRSAAFQLYGYDAATSKVQLLTPNLAKTDGANHDILFPVLSGDGATAGFFSYATDIVTNDDKNENDVFIVPTSGAQSPTLVSVPLPTVESATGNNSSELRGNLLSADGRFVAFSSLASDLVPNDDNNNLDIFRRDLRSGTTQLVSVSPDAVHPLPGSSMLLDMSRDGRFVAFSTTNLTQPAATPGIYVYDAVAGTNAVASILPDGTAAASTEGFLSADGQYLTFRVTTGNSPGVFLREMATGRTHAVTNSTVQQLVGISPLGRYVVLYAGGPFGIRLADWRAGTAIALPSNGNPTSQFSEDESKVLFYTTPLAPGGGYPLYLYSISQGSSNLIGTNVTVAALSADGSILMTQQTVSKSGFKLAIHDLQSGQSSDIPLLQPDPFFRIRGTPVLSRDGRFLAFTSTNAVAGGDNDAFNNVFVYDRVLGTLTLVSHTPQGDYGTFGSSNPSISGDGRTIVFQSGAPDLVAEDLNFSPDVFVAHIQITDTDKDGLDDGWEIARFGNLSSGAQDDSDGDGASNLAEYLSGTNPKDAQSRFAIQPLLRSSEGNVQITWGTVPGQTYQVQFRSDLGTGAWTDLPPAVTAIGNTLSVEGATSGHPSGFYRIITAQ
jgi:Tol biopolymer transport system component